MALQKSFADELDQLTRYLKNDKNEDQTKFEDDNSVSAPPKVYADNPFCPTNHESFWCATLNKEVVSRPDTAKNLVDTVKELSRYWNHNYTKGKVLQNVGLENDFISSAIV